MSNLIPVEFKNQRIITTKVLAEEFGTEEKNIQMNFSRNEERFVEGKHYYKLEGEALKEFKSSLPTESREPIKFAPVLYLWTERGAARHAKILDTDEAWDVYEELEETYFRVKELKVGQPQLIIPDLKQKEIETKNNNSFARVVNSIEKALRNPNVTKKTKDNLNNKLNQFLGEEPKDVKHLGRKTYSATEIGKKLGVSSQKIGRLSEAHKLKTEEFGEWFKDKSKYSSKEVPSFRYYENVIPVLKGLLDGKQENLSV